ncbi:MAG: hypothetical protein ACTSPX_01000, partial [Candidatus Thorarchaeota archaeon]
MPRTSWSRAGHMTRPMLHNPFVPGCHKFFGEGILSTKHIESVIAIPLMLLVIYLAYASGPSWDSVRGAAAMYSA